MEGHLAGGEHARLSLVRERLRHHWRRRVRFWETGGKRRRGGRAPPVGSFASGAGVGGGCAGTKDASRRWG